MDEQAVLSVNLANTRTDFLKFLRRARRKLGLLPYALIANALAVVVVFTLHDTLSSLPWVRKHVFDDYSALYYAALMVLFVLFATMVFRIIGRNITFVGDGQEFLRPKKVRIDEKGLYETSKVSDCFFAWSGITRIEKTPGYLLFYTDALRAFVIPLRQFESTQAAAAFFEAAQKLKEEAVSAPAAAS